MLAIRMQRTGRTRRASYRVVVQDSRQTPTSGKFVALLGNYDPHTKTANLVKDKAQHYLSHGAQPSERVALLFKKEGIKLPSWVSINGKKTKAIRSAEKLRRNRPAEAEVEAKPVEAKKEEPVVAEEAPVTEGETTEPAQPAPENTEDAKDTPDEPAAAPPDGKASA